MVDRIFGFIALLITVGYGYIAFTKIHAPFQYDPLGPETWPQLLAIAAGICCCYILIFPDQIKLKLAGSTVARVALVVVMLAAYGYTFELLGFILSTALFCAMLSRMLGAGLGAAVIFGIASGVVGYGLCSGLLDLNLPSGELLKYLRGLS